VGVLRAYQLLVSPLLGPVCRYAPSCSSYAVQAVTTHGALRGSALAARRVLRCHPWAAGGWDPVPAPRGARATAAAPAAEAVPAPTREPAPEPARTS
jgi:putative membrane protein insertion efficiency factor